jgi:hypothetical protein
MKMTLLIVAAIALLAGSTLAMMNSACTSGQHSWCAPVAVSDITQKQVTADRVG